MKADTTARQGPLGAWYPAPLSPAQAKERLRDYEQRRQQRLRRAKEEGPCLQLAILAARFLSAPAQNIEQEYQRMKGGFRRRRSRRASALLELLYGQLLISHRLNGAIEHLQQGFELAGPLFAPDDYFRVLERHRLLRQLPLSACPSETEPLERLLVTARVIERMRQSERSRPGYRHDPKDTYG